jgi:SAM-dependent methyltransferase
MNLPDHARENKAAWEAEAANYVEPARRDWATDEISWGMYRVPEAEVGALPDVAGMDVVELGCGTAYFSAWLARRGARPTGVDVTENQLATARAMQAEHGVEFPLLQASAEDVPLPDGCADLVLSEYGASLWCEPDAWLAEAARLLRPDGHLVFLTNSVLVVLTAPDDGSPNGDRLVRSQRAISPLRFEGEDSVEFHLSHGDWVAALARRGFAATGLHELYAPDGAEPTRYDWMTVEWARRWPIEDLWTARLGDAAPR